MGETQAPVQAHDVRGSEAVLAVGLFIGVRAVGLLTLGVLASLDGRRLMGILTKWDGQWYAGIAENGYGFVRHHPDGRLLADYAFFPLLPALERGLNALLGIEAAAAGVLIAMLSAPLAALGIYRCVERSLDARTAMITVVLWGSLPVAAVQTMAYTESLFTALAAWSLFLAMNARWLPAAGLASLAALARPTGVAVTAAVLVAIALSVQDEGRLNARQVAACSLAALGSIAFVGWVGMRTGAAAGYFRVTSGWGNGFDGGRAFALWVTDQPVPLAVLIGLGVAGVFLLLLRGYRLKLPAPLLIYASVLLVLSFGTSGYFGSKPRYLVPAFVLLVPIAHWLARSSERVRWGVLGALALMSVGYGAWWLLGSGPP